MKKIFLTLAVLLAFAITAVDVSAATLQERRNDVADELTLVSQDIAAQRAVLVARFQSLPAGPEKTFVRSQISILSGRLAFVRTARRAAKTSYSDVQLDILINRFDLNVSLS